MMSHVCFWVQMALYCVSIARVRGLCKTPAPLANNIIIGSKGCDADSPEGAICKRSCRVGYSYQEGGRPPAIHCQAGEWRPSALKPCINKDQKERPTTSSIPFAVIVSIIVAIIVAPSFVVAVIYLGLGKFREQRLNVEATVVDGEFGVADSFGEVKEKNDSAMKITGHGNRSRPISSGELTVTFADSCKNPDMNSMLDIPSTVHRRPAPSLQQNSGENWHPAPGDSQMHRTPPAGSFEEQPQAAHGPPSNEHQLKRSLKPDSPRARPAHKSSRQPASRSPGRNASRPQSRHKHGLPSKHK